MEINIAFTLTWWMVCLLLIVLSPVIGLIMESLKPSDWGARGGIVWLLGWIIAVGIAIGQLF